jgi:hypothetical protein
VIGASDKHEHPAEVSTHTRNNRYALWSAVALFSHRFLAAPNRVLYRPLQKRRSASSTPHSYEVVVKPSRRPQVFCFF